MSREPCRDVGVLPSPALAGPGVGGSVPAGLHARLRSGAVVAVAIGRLFGPGPNINYAFVDPILKTTWGGPVTHVTVISGALVLVAYPLTHVLLVRLCPQEGSDRLWRSSSIADTSADTTGT
jgi:hypothetical protein